jgi:hypothetical protein
VTPGCADHPCGTVFQLTTPASPGSAWTKTTLHEFQGGADGWYPMRLALDLKGTLYGATLYGGGSPACSAAYPKVGCGTVFQLMP